MKFDRTVTRKHKRMKKTGEKIEWNRFFRLLLYAPDNHRFTRTAMSWHFFRRRIHSHSPTPLTPQTVRVLSHSLFIRWWVWFNRFSMHVGSGHTFKLFSHYNRIRNRAENLFSPLSLPSTSPFHWISLHPQKNSFHFVFIDSSMDNPIWGI